jgi:hypothetical protein
MERLKTITREELKAKMDRGDDFILLEVLSELLPDKDAEVVAYCSNFH